MNNLTKCLMTKGEKVLELDIQTSSCGEFWDILTQKEVKNCMEIYKF